ncbi:hypothetical protein SEPCBS119000_006050 [Sporothrix epigloea]|uniref:Gag protein n=1 Tax=Sporothrix epigloea TaxID=1892477 RepID=A0ABP0E498_9PEZI
MPNKLYRSDWTILHTRKDWRRWYSNVRCVAGLEWKHFSPEDDHVPGPSLVAPKFPAMEPHQPFEYEEGLTEAEQEKAVRQYQLENDIIYRNTQLRWQEFSYEYQTYRDFKKADRNLSEHMNATVSNHIRSQISAFGSAAERLAYLYTHYKEDHYEACEDAAKNYKDLMLDFSPTESWIARWEETVENCIRLELAEISRGRWLNDLRTLLSHSDPDVAYTAYHEYSKGEKKHTPENVIKWAHELRRMESLVPERVDNGIVHPPAYAPDDSDDDSQAQRKRRRSEAATDEQQPPSRRPRQARYGQKPLCKACNQAVHQIDRCWAVFPHKAPSTVSSSDLNTLKQRMEAAAAQDPVLRVEINRARQREANR